MTLAPDTILNQRYRILSILGQGGMGSVYKAMDEILGVEVAVKENLFLSDEYSRQFEQEARILAGLRHPNLPRVGDYFYITGQGQYLIMDYIDGEDLRERIDRLGCVPEKDVVLIGIEICNALTYLHTRPSSVLHRDIKPGNIKISPAGEVLLVDFGLAKVVVDGDQVTRTGARAMTPGYSPPEQYGTARTDVRTDIYSLGATLYAALTGLIPEDALERATGRVKLTPLRQIKPNISRKLSSVIEKALQVEPENRFQSADEFKVALGAAVNALEYTQSRPHIVPAPKNEQISHQDSHEPAPISSEQEKSTGSQAPAHTSATRFWVRLALLASTAASLAALYLLQPGLSTALITGLFTTATPFSSVAQANDSTSNTSRPGGSIQTTPTRTLSPEPTSTFTPTATPTITLTPTPAATGVGGGAAQIAFSSDRTGRNQIWLVQSDGSRLEQLTNLPDGACQSNWSPDGKNLAFISPCLTKMYLYEGSKIYIMNMENGQISLMPGTVESDFDPAWSPDGKSLAFTSMRNGIAHVFSYNFEDGSLQELSDTRFADMQPAWNPDGTQLAVVRQNIYNHIYIISSRGFSQYDFSSSGNVDDYYPHWSPDGSYIIFNRVSEGTPSIPYMVGLLYEDHGTGKEARIPALGSENDPGPIWDPAISTDGYWIAFEGWPDGRNHDIYLMDIAGQGYIRVTTDPGIDFDPAWRPLPN